VLDAASGPGTSSATVPFVGALGEAALMTQAGTREAYLALVAPGSSWTNETPARSVLAIQAYSPDAIARTQDAPVLMVVAMGDTVSPPEPARALAETIGARVVEVGGGHFDVYTGAGFERVIAEEIGFLRSLGLTAGP
jgi:predicted alpha/beta hydrolase family esterase